MPETKTEPLTREDRIREQLILYSPTDCIGDKHHAHYEALQEELDELENAEEFYEY